MPRKTGFDRALMRLKRAVQILDNLKEKGATTTCAELNKLIRPGTYEHTRKGYADDGTVIERLSLYLVSGAVVCQDEDRTKFFVLATIASDGADAGLTVVIPILKTGGFFGMTHLEESESFGNAYRLIRQGPSRAIKRPR